MLVSKAFPCVFTSRNCFTKRLSIFKFTRKYSKDTTKPYVSSTTRCGMEIDPAVEKQLIEGTKHRHHPGIRVTTPIKVPERFAKAVHALFQSSDLRSKDVEKEAERFRNRMIARKLPPTKEDVLTEATVILENIIEKDDIDVEALDQEVKEQVEETRKNEMMKKLTAKVYHWKPIEYDEHDSILYVYGLFAPNYATMFRIFSEIKLMAPNFTPTTLLDFGSGVGSVVWAANECFDSKISEVLCVDASSDMSKLAQVLLQDGDPKGEVWLKHISFKRYLPPSNITKYDLVVCAHTLMDMPTSKERIQVLNNLWNKTTGMLVIVEHGSFAGYSLVAEAREYILSKMNKDLANQNVHVVAPCQHNLPCPRLLTTAKRPCSFPSKFSPFSLMKEKNHRMEKYSYVVISKTKQTETRTWPRLVSPVLKRPSHVVCRFCNVDGQLYESVVTKLKNGRHMYRLARSSHWGDLLPGSAVQKETVTEFIDKSSESDSESDSEEKEEK